jgi:glycosyltransferase involved in cell wall biosynthesis
LKWDLQRLLNSNDIVFFEWADNLLVQASQMQHTCKIVTRLHRFELYERAQYINWDGVNQIITVSSSKRHELEKQFPACIGKISVIPSAVSLRKFAFEPHPVNHRIGTLSHLFSRKRVYELILAFYELTLHGYPQATLHIVGGRKKYYEDYEVALHQLVKKLHLEKCVQFYGHVTDPASWYQNLDIFVSNAYSEGLPAALLEAMACGCYSLTHCWDGVEEVLPDTQIFYTNTELISKMIKYFQTSSTEQQVLQSRMRQIVEERFNLDQTKVQMRNLIEEVAIK